MRLRRRGNRIAVQILVATAALAACSRAAASSTQQIRHNATELGDSSSATGTAAGGIAPGDTLSSSGRRLLRASSSSEGLVAAGDSHEPHSAPDRHDFGTALGQVAFAVKQAGNKVAPASPQRSLGATAAAAEPGRAGMPSAEQRRLQQQKDQQQEREQQQEQQQRGPSAEQRQWEQQQQQGQQEQVRHQQQEEAWRRAAGIPVNGNLYTRRAAQVPGGADANADANADAGLLFRPSRSHPAAVRCTATQPRSRPAGTWDAMRRLGFSATQAVSTAGGGDGSRQAYVTLLYGDAFLLGVRVLGQSLRETGTTRCGRSEPSMFSLTIVERSASASADRVSVQDPCRMLCTAGWQRWRQAQGAQGGHQEAGCAACRQCHLPSPNFDPPPVCRDLVVLVAGPLSRDSEDTLVNEGWTVRHVDPIRNPGMWRLGNGGGGGGQPAFPPRFWAVYTKLAIFNMTEYEKGGSPGRLVIRTALDS